MRGRSRAALSDASVAAQNDFPSAHLGVRASSTAHIEWVLSYLYVARGGAVPFPPLLRRKAAHRDKVAKRLRPVARWLQVGESLRRFIRSIKAVELFRIVVHSHTSKLAAARTSAMPRSFPPKADIADAMRNVRFVPYPNLLATGDDSRRE